MDTAKTNSIGDGKTGCLVCGDSDTRITRGLCVMHHNRWRKQRESLPESARKAFDKELIERGLLLPSRQGRPAIDDDVFADVAMEILREIAAKGTHVSSLVGDAAARMAEEMVAEAEVEAEQWVEKKKKVSRGGGKRKKT